MKILKEPENVIWFGRDNKWAVVGKGSGQVHAVFAEKHHAELFCDAIEALLAERDALKAANNELREENELVGKQMDRFADQIEALENERDALAARLAPVEDEALVEIAMTEIEKVIASSNDSETVGYGKWEPAAWWAGRAAIAAIRPHIEAAERERCAKVAENQYERMKNKGYVSVDWMQGYLSAALDIRSAIRSGK